MAVFASTNATALTDEIIGRIVAERLLDLLQVSIDGATRETYQKIRIGGDYDRVLRTLARIRDERARQSVTAPGIRVEMVVMRPNAGEVAAFVRQMLAIGVDAIQLDMVKAHPELLVDDPEGLRRLRNQLRQAREAARASTALLSGTALKEVDLPVGPGRAN